MKAGNGNEPSIRFITSHYKELFRIPDGGTIQVTFPDRQFAEKCEYIDDYHTRIGGVVYHICQYAEMLEQTGGRCEPEPEITGDAAAWKIGYQDRLLISRCDEGWDYTLYDQDFHEIDGGILTDPECSMLEAREEILKMHKRSSKVRIRADYETVEYLAAQEADKALQEQLEKRKRHRADRER